MCMWRRSHYLWRKHSTRCWLLWWRALKDTLDNAVTSSGGLKLLSRTSKAWRKCSLLLWMYCAECDIFVVVVIWPKPVYIKSDFLDPSISSFSTLCVYHHLPYAQSNQCDVRGHCWGHLDLAISDTIVMRNGIVKVQSYRCTVAVLLK